MRHITFILFAAILTGCGSSSFHSAFITTLGSHTTFDGNWRIKASAVSLDISHPSSVQRGDWVTHSPDNWKTHTGWFIYFESPKSVWAYDGDRRLILEELTGVEDYSAMSEMLFQREVPREVFSRLSQNTQEAIMFLKKQPNKSPEPTSAGAGSSATRTTP
jgi:hypothetical protein